MTEGTLTGTTGTRRAIVLASALALAVVVPLVGGGIPIGPFQLDAAMVGTAATVVAALPWLASKRARGLVTGSVEAVAFVFLGVATVSVAANGFAADDLLTLIRYAGYVALMAVVATLATGTGSRRLIAWAVTVGAAGSTVAGAAWYLGRRAELLRAAEQAGTGAPQIVLRVEATFGNPNFYGEFLLLALAVSAFLVITERGWLRGVAVLALAAELLMLVLTYTRGSWLALIAGALLCALIVDVRLLWAYLVSGVALAVAVPGVLARLMSVASTDGTGGFRLRLWKIAGAAIADRPLVGWGPGAFYEAFGATVLARPDLGVGYTEYGAHNAYFTLAAETGVLGGVAFVALVAAVVFVGVRGALSVGRGIARAPIAVLAAGLLAFSLNSLTSNSFQHPQATVFFWVVAGLMLGAVYGRGRGVDAGAPAPSLAGRAFADSLVGRLTTGDASGGAWRSSRFASALSGVPAAHSQALAASLTLGWAVRGSAVGLAEAPAVLLVANMYPSVRNPKFGSFVAELERAMRAGGRRVTLVANDDSRTGARASAGKYSRFAWRTFMAACRGGYGVVHAHYLFPAGVFAVMAARMRGVPLVVFSHGSDVLLRGWRWPVGALASWVVRSADIVTVPSEHHASAVREAFGAAARRIEVLPIGVDTDVFSPGDRASARTECQLPAEDRIVTFLGALDDNKGVGCQRLIEALSADEFDGVRLVVMGEGPREAELRETTARLGMSGRVTVRPFADRGGVVALLRAADVVAVPSLRESLGLIALEAEAVGTPVAASAVGGLLEHVIPGVNGELFDPSDVGDIRRALRSILNEPERYRAGFDASRYSLSGTAERLAALDRELTEA